MEKTEEQAKELEEIALKLAIATGILGRVILNLPKEDPNQRSLRTILRIICSAIKSLSPKTALEKIIEGFALSHGDFKEVVLLFEILKRNELPKNFAPSFHLVPLSEAPRELGFIYKDAQLKLIPKNENAGYVVSKMIEIVRERARISRAKSTPRG